MRLRRTLYGTIIRWYTLCTVAVLIVYTVILHEEIERGRRVPFDVQLDAHGARVASCLYADQGMLDLVHLPVHELTNAIFAVYDMAWQPLLVSMPWYYVRWRTNHLAQAEFAERIAAGKRYHGRLRNALGQDMRVSLTCAHVPPLPRSLGGSTTNASPLRVYVITANVYEPIKEFVWRQKYRAAAAVVVVSLAALGSGVILARRGLRPIKRLTRIAQLVTPEDARTRLPVSTLPEELRELAQCVNAAFDRLGTALLAERTFTSAAAHELRSPLANLIARLDALLQRTDLPDDLRNQLSVVREEAARLTRITGQLLLLARLDRAAAGESFPMTEVDVEELVRDVADSLEPSVREKHLNVEIQADAGTRVRGHEEWLLRAVYNVFHNAIKFSPPHGHLQVHITPTADGKRVLLSVSDEGPGIPAEERQRVFDRFYRGASALGTEGSGLGLAIVADIVRAHHGEVFLSTGPGGRGTTITLILPCDPRNAPPAKRPQAADVRPLT
ncbi:MAG: HAMP domain-containing histidine kinase [bacterium]|nr:HAMP domain-containing histidine kinase [bacterium]